MGGPGSGRWPSKTSVAEARQLSIAELCDGGRVTSHPQGEITWHTARGRVWARLRYKIYEEPWPAGPTLLILALRYRYDPAAPELPERLILERMGGGAYRSRCPRCERPLRILYAPREAEYFFCRVCHGLVYRGPSKRKEANQNLARVQEAIAPLIAGLAPWQESRLTAAGKRRERVELLAQIEEDRPLFREERIVYSLRLARVGLSLRQIAAVLGCSKSSVQRYVAAGFWEVDFHALARDRLDRIPSPFALPLDTGPREWRAYLRAVQPELAKAARYWRTHQDFQSRCTEPLVQASPRSVMAQ